MYIFRSLFIKLIFKFTGTFSKNTDSSTKSLQLNAGLSIVNGIVDSTLMKVLLSIDFFKYLTCACEVNPTKVTYEDAIKLAKSVLPDDIKEIRKKYDSSTTKTYIVYSSSQSNFIVGIAYDYKKYHTDGFIPDSDKDIVVGIDYMNEINQDFDRIV